MIRLYSFEVLVALAVTVALTSVALAGFPAGDFVTELDDKLFESDIRSRPKDGFYLVEFYSPTCGHCRAFAPIYEEVGDSLRSIIPVGRLSVHDYRDLTSEYKVKGVPHVALFLPQNDNPIVYQDDKNVKDIVEWVLGAMIEFEVPMKELKANEMDAFLNVQKKIYPSRYLMISAGSTSIWGAVQKRAGTKAILAHMNANLIDISKSQFNISRLPAAVAHMRAKESDPADAPIEIITFQGSAMMSEIQRAMIKEKAFDDSSTPLKDDVSTEGMINTKADGANQTYDLATISVAVVGIFVCTCFGLFWFYKNRNKKVKEVVPVNLEGVTWEVGGKKALD